jgi:hypothetical protein
MKCPRSTFLLSYLRICIGIAIWFFSIFLYFTSLGRLSEFFNKIYEHVPFSVAFFSFANRPVPLDIFSIGIGIFLLIIITSQFILFKKNWLKIQIFSLSRILFSVLYFIGSDFISWSYTKSWSPIPINFGFIIISCYIFLGALILSAWFLKSIKYQLVLPEKRIDIYIFYAASIWTNMAFVLLLIQVILIYFLRGVR